MNFRRNVDRWLSRCMSQLNSVGANCRDTRVDRKATREHGGKEENDAYAVSLVL